VVVVEDHVVLVGRDDELARLGGLVGDLVGGRGGSVWVEGEPGIGKSALLAAGLAGAQRQGCRVFWAAGEELGQRFPLRVMLDCLQVGPRSPDPARREIAGLLQGGQSTGRQSARALADPVPAVSERLLALVDRQCASAPVLLVVDDLQWADEASLSLWHRLARAVDQLPLLLVGACRPVPQRAALVALRRSQVSGDGVLLTLAPLPAGGAVELAGAVAGAGSVGPRLRRAVEQAAGNPLYVRELVDALGRDRLLAHAGGSVELVEDAAATRVPLSLATTISDRLGFLSAPTLSVVRAAALLGVQCTVADLTAVAGTSALDLATAVAEAAAAGVLVESGQQLAFRHALIRQALHDGTPSGLRLALHAQAARALAGAGVAVERVAEQLLAAIPADASPAPEDWVLDWLAGPGRTLASRTPQIAAELLASALPGVPAGDPRREELTANLASVHFVLGQHQQAARLARQVLAMTHDPTRAAAATETLGWALIRMQRYEQARAAIERGLSGLSLDGGWRVRLRALLALVVSIVGDLDEARTLAEDVITAAERAGERVAAASALNTLASVLVRREDRTGGLAAVERGLALVGDDPATDDPETTDLRLLLMQNRTSTLRNFDRMPEVRVAVRETVTAAERFAAPPRLAAVRVNAAEQWYQLGQWDDALAELETVSDMVLPTALPYQMTVQGISALIAAHRDQPAVADAHLAVVADQPIGKDEASYLALYVLMARALLAERRGHPDQALAVFTGMLDPARGPWPSERHLWVADAVRLALAVGDFVTARAVAEAGEPPAATEPTPSRTAAAEHCRGLLDADPARLTSAADTYRTIGLPLQLAHACEDAATVLAERGDLRAARAAYTEATGIYTSLAADWDLLRAATRLRPYGIRRRGQATRRPITGWEALTPTELKVARLVEQGHANPDIAASLFLSRRTVEVHVSHILTKLGVRSRVQIARMAAAHG